MPSIYQLLPRPRHRAVVDANDPSRAVDLYDPALRERLGWGLAGARQEKVLERLLPDISSVAERREVALDHQRKCLERARRFAEAVDEPAPDPPASLHLMAGDARPTAAVIAVNLSDGSLRTIERSPGDGTVTRGSALMDERMDGQWQPTLRSPIRWSGVHFIFTDHLGLTMDPVFTDNVLYILLEQPRGSIGASP